MDVTKRWLSVVSIARTCWVFLTSTFRKWPFGSTSLNPLRGMLKELQSSTTFLSHFLSSLGTQHRAFTEWRDVLLYESFHGEWLLSLLPNHQKLLWMYGLDAFIDHFKVCVIVPFLRVHRSQPKRENESSSIVGLHHPFSDKHLCGVSQDDRTSISCPRSHLHQLALSKQASKMTKTFNSFSFIQLRAPSTHWTLEQSRGTPCFTTRWTC